MPLDLDAIRRRWAATPWTNGRSPELAADIAAMFSELDRLTAALAAAQAAPVVEWPALLSWTLVHRDGRRVWITMRGAFTFDVLDVPDPEYAVGWFMAVNDAHPSDEGWGGPETGPAGKAAAEAAYRRACGLPAIPACAG